MNHFSLGAQVVRVKINKNQFAEVFPNEAVPHALFTGELQTILSKYDILAKDINSQCTLAEFRDRANLLFKHRNNPRKLRNLLVHQANGSSRSVNRNLKQIFSFRLETVSGICIDDLITRPDLLAQSLITMCFNVAEENGRPSSTHTAHLVFDLYDLCERIFKRKPSLYIYENIGKSDFFSFFRACIQLLPEDTRPKFSDANIKKILLQSKAKKKS